ERDLLDITNTLALYRDPEKLFPAMMEALQRLVDFDRSTVFRLEGEWLHPIATSASAHERADMVESHRWKESGARAAIETRRPARYPIEEQVNPRTRILAEMGFRTVAYVPVIGRDRVLAVFALTSRSPAALGPDDLSQVARAA